MPPRSLRPCAHPGCNELVTLGRCEKHASEQRQTHHRYYQDPNIQRMYNSKRWGRIRAEQLEREPYCRNHLRQGVYVRATEVDHIEPHDGDPNLFWNGDRQSLCKACHVAKTNQERANRPQGGQKSFGNSNVKSGFPGIKK